MMATATGSLSYLLVLSILCFEAWSFTFTSTKLQMATRQIQKRPTTVPRNIQVDGQDMQSIDTLTQKFPALEEQPLEVDCVNGEFWRWEGKGKIHYVTAGSEGPPILLLPGFGVGTFHFGGQLGALAAAGHRVWAFDLLGQGKSWPESDEDEEGLSFSVEMWTEQVVTFVEEVIGEPVFLVGNSLGGLLAASAGAARPDLTRGVCLLNAAPFWAFLPARAKSNALLERALPWDGVLPAPAPYFWVGSRWFDGLRDRKTIKGLFGFVYSSTDMVDDDLVENIVASTNRGRGHTAFTSIVFSRKATRDFEENLALLQCPVTLLYGKDDPWITPLWGKKASRALGPRAAYYELSPAGHCPHHECPRAANAALRAWVQAAAVAQEATYSVGSSPKERRAAAAAAGWACPGFEAPWPSSSTMGGAPAPAGREEGGSSSGGGGGGGGTEEEELVAAAAAAVWFQEADGRAVALTRRAVGTTPRGGGWLAGLL